MKRSQSGNDLSKTKEPPQPQEKSQLPVNNTFVSSMLRNSSQVNHIY